MFPCHFENFLINIQIACCKVLYHTKSVTYMRCFNSNNSAVTPTIPKKLPNNEMSGIPLLFPVPVYTF